MKKSNAPFFFIQDHEPFNEQTLVMVGVPAKKELYKWLKKEKINVKFSAWVLGQVDVWRERLENKNNGLFCWHDDVPGTVLVLHPFMDSWNYWETLMHEIHHLVLHIAKKKLMTEEMEAQAYLFENTFRTIRRRLQNTT